MSNVYKNNTGSGPPSGTVLTLEGNVGGKVSPDSSGNINIIGPPDSGIVFTGTPSDNTLTLTIPGVFFWTVVTTDQNMTVGTGYFADASSGPGLTFRLPTPGAPVGSLVAVYSLTGVDFGILQNANQQIQVNDLTSTPGTSGNVGSTNQQGNALFLICAGLIGGIETWVAFPNQASLVVS